ncbi:DNA-binding protein [Pelagerythrobacter aerophilus]|uniref:DNA-binding protein n=1 Tax=Pelagerythrobacter aerophilus TaxID=2306995 RepID=A0A418NKT9_9SPHN|nr:DNA-binding protein [Pelagerythrobacter aerophilus]
MNAHFTPKPRPYSVAQLAERWGCSEGLVYKLIRSGDLQCFRPGALIRISAAEVERYECQASNENIPSSDSTKASQSSGGRTPARGRSVAVIDSPRKIGPPPRQRRQSAGKSATVHRGPWAD